MLTLLRLYRFHRRSGMNRRRAVLRAWANVRRSINSTGSNK